MKLRIEVPANVLSTAHPRWDSTSQYDAHGNYLGSKQLERTYLRVGVRNKEEFSPERRKELSKLTKHQLIRKLEDSDYREFEMEII